MQKPHKRSSGNPPARACVCTRKGEQNFWVIFMKADVLQSLRHVFSVFQVL